MNPALVATLCEIAAANNDAHLLVSLGWIDAATRQQSRQDEWKSWKVVCGRLMTQQLCESSLHRYDLLLSTRSRCYTANANGYFVPHGGNGSERCGNLDHYYVNTLQPCWPKSDPTSSCYVAWTLERLSRDYNAKTRTQRRLEEKWAEHRRVCALLAERPWLAEQCQQLLDGKADELKSVITLKRKYNNF